MMDVRRGWAAVVCTWLAVAATAASASDLSRDAAVLDLLSAPWGRDTVGRVHDRAQAELTVARLAAFRGSGTATARGAHAFVSALGVLGMFAAIVGAMLGLWLDEAGDGDDDDADGFCYWESDMDADDGAEREAHYGVMRLGEYLSLD